MRFTSWRTVSLFMDNVIVCEGLVKIYKTKDLEVLALQGLDLQIAQGELMAIIGNSGSGKSTLLNMIGGLDRPSAGKLFVDGKDLFKLTESELVQYKRRTVGFVWQNNARNLVPYLTAFENVLMPMQFAGTPRGKAAAKATELLELAGIAGKRNNRLSQLSGGEQQRVAIAIALSNEPKVLLADEPTGSVDVKTSNYLLDVFRTINRTLGTTIVIVTHDRELSKKVNRVVSIRDGKTSSEMIMKQSYSDRLDGIASFENAVNETVHDEFGVLDKAGRVQIPKEYLDKLGLDGNKIRIGYVDGRIVMEAPEKD